MSQFLWINLNLICLEQNKIKVYLDEAYYKLTNLIKRIYKVYDYYIIKNSSIINLNLKWLI